MLTVDGSGNKIPRVNNLARSAKSGGGDKLNLKKTGKKFSSIKKVEN